MQQDFQHRRVLITGGSAGLGLAAARMMAERGARVAIAARSADKLQAAAESLRQATGAEILPVVCDVARAEDISHLAQSVQQAWGGVDVLLNNAGGSSRMPSLEISDEVWQRDLDLKLFSAIRLVRLVAPGMKERRWGRIVNVLNTLAKTPPGGSAPTSVTRAAGMAYAKVLSHELAPFNVLVNAVCIGRIESEQWPRFHQADAPELSYTEYLAREGRKIPLGRLGKAEEFAALVCLLASEGGGYITGTAINIDGGASPAD